MMQKMIFIINLYTKEFKYKKKKKFSQFVE